jgi:hypothetical protein
VADHLERRWSPEQISRLLPGLASSSGRRNT